MSCSATTPAIRRCLVLALVTATAIHAPPAAAAAQDDGQWWQVQWEMDRVWPVSDGDGVTIAVLDSGVDASLPAFAGAVSAGADFTGRGGDGTIDHDPDSHGTAMAGLVAARGGGSGIVGVAPGATILPVVVDVAGDGAGFADRLSQGIRYAVDRGAQVISVSLGDSGRTGGPTDEGCPRSVADAARYAAARDVVVVASSGNDSSGISEYPGVCPGVLTAGANDQRLKPWKDSHRSEYVDVSAPGVSIPVIIQGGGVGISDGTSSATALVAGAVALVRAEFPDDSADDVLRRIINTAGDIHTAGRDDATGYGVVQPYYALTEPLPPGAPNPVYERLSDPEGTGSPQAGLTDVSPLRPALDSAGSGGGTGLGTVALMAIVGGLVVAAFVAVLIVVIVASSRHRRRPRPAAAPRYPYPPNAPPYPRPPGPPR